MHSAIWKSLGLPCLWRARRLRTRPRSSSCRQTSEKATPREGARFWWLRLRRMLVTVRATVSGSRISSGALSSWKLSRCSKVAARNPQARRRRPRRIPVGAAHGLHDGHRGGPGEVRRGLPREDRSAARQRLVRVPRRAVFDAAPRHAAARAVPAICEPQRRDALLGFFSRCRAGAGLGFGGHLPGRLVRGRTHDNRGRLAGAGAFPRREAHLRPRTLNIPTRSTASRASSREPAVCS